MTMRELAKAANVSVSTVSKAFHGAEDISRETREHVFAVAKALGCYGKFYQGKYDKKVIAVICPELVGVFYSTYTELLQELIEKAGCICSISTDHFRPKVQAQLIEYYSEYLKVDGILVFDLQTKLKKGHTTPIVSLYSNKDTTADCVGIDIKSAIVDAIKLLLEYGHTKIAFLGETLTTQKAQYFYEAATELLQGEPQIVTSAYRFEKAGEDAVAQLGSDVTALICAYDNIALGAIRQLQSMGLRVPEDMSVIGINNIRVSEYTQLPLSTIDTNPEEVCKLAWDIIQKKQKSKYYHIRQAITATGRLILRSTTGQRKK